MRRWFSFIGLITAFALPGCGSDETAEPAASIPVRYQYTSRDSNGVAIAQGRIDLVFRPVRAGENSSSAATVTGSWDIVPVGDPGGIGPQTGTGAVQGSVHRDRSVHLDLNPGFADANVLLDGSFDTAFYGAFSGEWLFVGFDGVVNHGTFRAGKP